MLQRFDVAVVFDDDVERLADRATVDHDVAGDDQPCAAMGPAAVDACELGGRLVRGAGELLTHRGLDEAVLDVGAVGEGQRRRQRRGRGRVGDGAHESSAVGGVVGQLVGAEPSWMARAMVRGRNRSRSMAAWATPGMSAAGPCWRGTTVRLARRSMPRTIASTTVSSSTVLKAPVKSLTSSTAAGLASASPIIGVRKMTGCTLPTVTPTARISSRSTSVIAATPALLAA